MEYTKETLTARLNRAKQRRQPWETMWEDCIDYCMPARQSFYDQSAGHERTDRVFDETPVLATAEFASRMQSSIMPPGRRWFRFEVAEQVDRNTRTRLQGQLDEVTEYLHGRIQQSNLDSEMHEAFMDIAIGTTAVYSELDSRDNLIVRTAPLPTIWIEEGADGRISAIFRERPKIKASHINYVYREAKVPEDLLKDDKEVDLYEATCRDYSDPTGEAWYYHVWASCTTENEFLVEREYKGWGSCPWVSARWSVTPDEWWGRGPLINLLPAIRSVNLIRELIFENAEIAIGGIWQYPNDGTINPDQIRIGPNTFIPKMPGSTGLEPLTSPSRFDIAEANLMELRAVIKRGLFSEEYTPKGKTPLSAYEVATLQTDLAQRIGSPFARVLKEMVQPLVTRVARLYVDAGLIEMPEIDGRMIKIVSVSPLARAQKAEDIQRLTNFIGTLVQFMGPQVTGTFIKTGETVQHMANLYEYPADLLHDDNSRMEEIKKNQKLAQEMQQGMQVSPAEEFQQRVERGDIQPNV